MIMTKPKMIIAVVSNYEDLSTVETKEPRIANAYNFISRPIERRHVDISMKIQLAGVGDFTEYWDDRTLLLNKLVSDIFTGEILIQSQP